MGAEFEIERAPGHLIRRAHQASVALFAEETAGHGMTPVQFAILDVLMDESGIDQVTLAGRVAFDVATIGSVIGRLEAKGWLLRQADERDRRRKLLWLTPEGKTAATSVLRAVETVQQRILEPLSPVEKQQLVALLVKLVTHHTGAEAS